MLNIKIKKSGTRNVGTAGGAAPGNVGLQGLLVITVVAVAVILAISAGAIIYLQQSSNQTADITRVRIGAQGLAGRLGDNIAIHNNQLIRVSQLIGLPELFEKDDLQALHKQEVVLRGQMPGIQWIRLLPSGWNDPGKKGEGQLSYASLDMLRVVEKSGKPAPAEIHKSGAGGHYVALAAPVKSPDTGAVVGVVHLAIPFAHLESLIGSIVEFGGPVALQQLVDGVYANFLEAGEGVPIGSQTGAVIIPGSIWQVAYWPGKRADASLWLLISVIIFGAALFIMLVIWLQSGRLKRALSADRVAIAELVRRRLAGQKGVVQKPFLSDLQPLVDALNALDIKAQSSPGSELADAGDQSEVSLVETDLMPDALPVEPSEVTAVTSPIFRAYDIRGVVGDELTQELVLELGRAIGSQAYDQGQQTVIVARDGRHSSASLCDALVRGLLASGRDVVDLGQVPTPLLYFATYFLGSDSGVMVTGSHNPPEYNGLKVVIGGETLSGEKIKGLKRRIETGNLMRGEGELQQQDLLPDYMNRIAEDVQLLRPMKVVVDCGNGVAGVAAPALLMALGCEVIPLYCEVNGDFPNHHPDPGQPENMQDLIAAVQQNGADLGVAFDGDGDRLGVVDSSGKLIWPDRLLMLLARDVLIRQPGADIIFDVKSSRNLSTEILAYGGRPIMWKCGHSLVKAKMRETGALLAGEFTGHLFFAERWYGFDDGIYASARLLEVLSADPRSSADVFAELPESVATPELVVPIAEGAGVQLLSRLTSDGQFSGATLDTVDGIRANFEDGWGLIRASNTLPAISLRFEADTPEALTRIQAMFREQLLAVEPDLKLPF